MDKGMLWGKFEANGSKVGAGHIFHLGAAAVREFGLKPGDRVNIYFDSVRKRMGVEVAADGDFALKVHGSKSNRLKVSITSFYRAHLSSCNLRLPARVELSRGRGRYLFVGVVPARKTKVRVRAVA